MNLSLLLITLAKCLVVAALVLAVGCFVYLAIELLEALDEGETFEDWRDLGDYSETESEMWGRLRREWNATRPFDQEEMQ